MSRVEMECPHCCNIVRMRAPRRSGDLSLCHGCGIVSVLVCTGDQPELRRLTPDQWQVVPSQMAFGAWQAMVQHGLRLQWMSVGPLL